jgi:hypothetical protein
MITISRVKYPHPGGIPGIVPVDCGVRALGLWSGADFETQKLKI